MTATATPHHPPRRQRVAALAPEDRRAALIQATIPLLREHGLLVTTRQIADAAGVAEGTIFGVFPDKASLVRAAVVQAFDPAPAVEIVRSMALITDLRDRLETVVELLSAGMAANAPLLAAVRGSAGSADDDDLLAAIHRSRDEIRAAVQAAIEPDHELLRRSPAIAAQLLLFMVFASRVGLGPLETLDSADLVSLLLDGLLVRPTEPPGETSC